MIGQITFVKPRVQELFWLLRVVLINPHWKVTSLMARWAVR